MFVASANHDLRDRASTRQLASDGILRDPVLSVWRSGCGSSREHAVWALTDFGIRCVIAPSFGDIFAGNARKNGLLLIRLPDERCARLRGEIEAAQYAPIEVDLEAQR